MTRSKRPVQPLDFSLGGARRRHQDGGSDGDRSDSRQASRKIRHHWFVRSCLSMNSHCGVPFGPKYPQTLPNVGEKPGKRIRCCFPFFWVLDSLHPERAWNPDSNERLLPLIGWTQNSILNFPNSFAAETIWLLTREWKASSRRCAQRFKKWNGSSGGFAQIRLRSCRVSIVNNKLDFFFCFRISWTLYYNEVSWRLFQHEIRKFVISFSFVPSVSCRITS